MPKTWYDVPLHNIKSLTLNLMNSPTSILTCKVRSVKALRYFLASSWEMREESLLIDSNRFWKKDTLVRRRCFVSEKGKQCNRQTRSWERSLQSSCVDRSSNGYLKKTSWFLALLCSLLAHDLRQFWKIFLWQPQYRLFTFLKNILPSFINNVTFKTWNLLRC